MLFLIMLKLVLLVVFFVYCEGKPDPNPLSAFNPYDVISSQFEKYRSNVDHEVLEVVSTIDSSLILTNNSSEFNDSCAKSIEVLARDVFTKDKYALEMLDSWGKVESGILEGNLKWIGWYDECMNAKPTDFKPKYCSVFVGTPSAMAPFGLSEATGITLGGCYPDTCSPSNISSLYEPLLRKMNFSVETTCHSSDASWDGKDVFGLLVFLLLIFVVAASSLYDYITSRRNDKIGSTSFLTNAALDECPSNEFRLKLLSSFSILSNTRKLLSTEQRPSDIHCLHGMRFLSMCWVILGHSLIFPIADSNNLLFLARYFMEHWEFQAIGNATFSVDTFFFLSGLLVAYLGMRQLVKRDGKMNVPLMYLFRYIRLTPPYALMILLSVSVWPKLGSGPLWSVVAEAQQASCGKYWYTNLLYFNNLFPSVMQGECYAWGWYLANDTQFYLLSPIFLYLLYAAPMIGLAVTSLMTLGSIIVTGVFSSITSQQPQALGMGLIAKAALYPPVASNTSNLSSADLSSYSVYMSDLYTKPWCRLGAYLVGIITGYIIHTYKIRMPKVLAFVGWIVAAGAACATIYGLYPAFSNPDTSLAQSLLDVNTAAFYNAVSRPVWTMALAWVVIACVNGYGGPVNVFLSWKAFIPLSRLTYCTYLVHPLVLWWLVATTETLYHNSIQLFIMIFSGVLIISTLCAFVISMIIEFPVMNLMKLWQNRMEVAKPLPTKLGPDSDVAPLVA